MSNRAPLIPPDLPAPDSLSVRRPVTSGQLASFGAALAHIWGAQPAQIIFQPYGPTAHDTGTIRVKYRASPNAEYAVFAAVPYGYTAGAIGSWKLTGARVETLYTHVDAAAVTSLADLTEVFYWVKAVNPDTLNEFVFTLTDCRPHVLIGWEAPRSELTGTDKHVDRSIGNALRLITDDAVAANPRGATRVIEGVLEARNDCRRNLAVWGHPYDAGGGIGGFIGNAGYLIGLASPSTKGVRVHPRNIIGGGVTDFPCRMQLYVSDVNASTFDLEVYDSTAGSPYTISAVNAAGWWPASPGLSLNCLAPTDVVKVKVVRTAGAGDIEIHSGLVYEADLA